MDIIDYSDYSMEELLEAEATINKLKYPLNYEALMKELEKRQEEVPTVVEDYVEEKTEETHNKLAVWVKALGVAQIFGGLAIFSFLSEWLMISAELDWLTLLLSMIIIPLNLFCGYTLLKEKHQWLWLSIVNQTLQIPGIAIGLLSFSYAAPLGVFAVFLWPNIGDFEITSQFGFELHFLQQPLQEGHLAINLIATVFVIILRRFKEGLEELGED